jgi:hypothetical protein
MVKIGNFDSSTTQLKAWLKAVPFNVKGTAYIGNLCNTIRFGAGRCIDGKCIDTAPVSKVTRVNKAVSITIVNSWSATAPVTLLVRSDLLVYIRKVTCHVGVQARVLQFSFSMCGRILLFLCESRSVRPATPSCSLWSATESSGGHSIESAGSRACAIAA